MAGFFTTSKLSLSLHMSHSDSKLSDGLWQIVQKEFGGREGHTCDLMALDSNSMTDAHGYSLPHFTPITSPGSSGVNLFTQDLASLGALMARPYVFPPMALTGPVLKFLQSFKQSCTVVVLDVFPKKYWWSLLINKAVKSRCLAVRGDGKLSWSRPKRGGCLTRAFLEICGFLQCVFRCVLAYILICCATGLWCVIGFFFSAL